MLTSEVHVNTSTFRREGFRKLSDTKMSRRNVKNLLFLLLFISASVASYLLFYAQRELPEAGQKKTWQERIQHMKIDQEELDRDGFHPELGVQELKNRIKGDKVDPPKRYYPGRPRNQVEEPPVIEESLPTETTLPDDQPAFLEDIIDKAKGFINGKDEDDNYRNNWGREPQDEFRAHNVDLSDQREDDSGVLEKNPIDKNGDDSSILENDDSRVPQDNLSDMKKKQNEHHTVPKEYLITNAFGQVIGEQLFDGGLNPNALKKKKYRKEGHSYVDGYKNEENVMPVPNVRHKIDKKPSRLGGWENDHMDNRNSFMGGADNSGKSLGNILRPFGVNGFNPFLGNRDDQRLSEKKKIGHKIGENPDDGLEAFDLKSGKANHWGDSPFQDRGPRERLKPGEIKRDPFAVKNNLRDSMAGLNNVDHGKLNKYPEEHIPKALHHGLRPNPNADEEVEGLNKGQVLHDSLQTPSQEELRRRFELQQRNEENRKDQERLRELYVLQKHEQARKDGVDKGDTMQGIELPENFQRQQQQQNSNEADMAPFKSTGQERLYIEDLTRVIPVHAKCVTFNFPTGPSPLCIHNEGKDDMSTSIEKDGVYEPEIMREFTDIMYQDERLGLIDIGAGIGIYSIAAALMERTVLAVEPLFRNYRLLHKTAQDNKVASKIVLVTQALDNVTYVGHMSYSEFTGGYGKVEITRLTPDVAKDRANIVHVTTLDNLTIAAPMTSALMKLDVTAGMENRILEGGSKFFEVIHVPYILTHWSRSTDPTSHMVLFSRLSHLGYKAKLAWNGADVNIDHLKKDLSYLVWKKKA